VLGAHPNDPYASYYRALCLPFLGTPYEQTIPFLQEQIRSFGPDPQLMHTLGREYLRAELPQLAEGWFRRTVQRVADHRQALAALIDVYRQLERVSELEGAYRNYLRNFPEDRRVRHQFAAFLFGRRRYARARAQLEELLPREPGSQSLRRMLALCYQRTRRYPEAILLYRELLLENPRAEELLRALVECLEQTGSRNTAIVLLEKAARMLRGSRWLALELARMHMAENHFEKAAAVLRKVVSESPGEWRAYHSLGELYGKMGNESFAQKFLQRADELRRAEELRAPR
jgi:tetratricopeptide (TPR) repeat protein